MKVTERTERFAAGIRGKERETFGAAGRPDARFPMVTVFIGQPTGEEFSSLVRCRMDKMQPAYERIFKYFIAEAENETGAASCRDLSGDPLSAESVRDHVRELFREETPFKNKLVLLVNYIFNTEYLQEAGGIRQVFDLIEETRKILAFPKQRSKVIFLLNEQLGGEEKAADIKNTIDELYYGQTKDPRLPADDHFLISNKTFTGSYISRAKEGRAIADLLFLFSAAGAEEASAPDHAGVRTIGFNNVEKPTGEIAKISVIALSEGINEKMAAISEHAGDPDRVSKNADKGPDGEAVPQIGRIIERFVKELPPDSVLEKFPRRSSAEAGPVRDLSSEEFDRLTMGAWGAFVREKTDGCLEALAAELNSGGGLKAELKDYLTRTLSVFEIRDLKDDRTKADRLYHALFGGSGRGFGSVSGAASGSRLRQDAARTLKKRVSGCAAFRELFSEVLGEMAEDAAGLFSDWALYMKSLEKVGLSKDRDLERYYRGLVRGFLRKNDAPLSEQLKRVKNADDMSALLDRALHELIECSPVYGFSLEDELKARLVDHADSQDVKNNILLTLSGSIEQYFNPTHQVLENPVLSGVFIRRGPDIVPELKANLPVETLFIDCGSGESIDALQIYRVGHIHLVK